MKVNSLQLFYKISVFLFLPILLQAQLGVNSDNSAPSTNAMLDVKSPTKGVLIPRVAADLASPTEGLLYYNTTGHNFRYYDGTAWQNALFGNQWNVNGTTISYSLGNVGIGTTTPVGTMDIYSVNAANLYFHNNVTGLSITDGFYIGNGNSTAGLIWNKENAPIRFGTNDDENMTILGNGNVGIGYNLPSYKLSVNGTIYSNGLNINGTSNINAFATFSTTVDINGTLNANSNLAVDGNITTNAGKGIVRSNDANQLAIDEYATPVNLSWNLNPGQSICCVGIGFSTFAAKPSIAFGETTGATNPSNILYTIESIDTNSAQIRVTNIGTANSTATGSGQFRAMIIGRK